MSSFLEIVQLANGEIVLRRADEDGDPLISISFSDESKSYIGEAGVDIAKAMIQAGIQAAAQIHDSLIEDDTEEGERDSETRIVH